MSVRLRLAKEFSSIQGEGALAGTPMYFVRTAGCSVTQCVLHPNVLNLCDTDWTFKYEDDTANVFQRSMDSLLPWICVTGGEPTDQLEGINELAFRGRQMRKLMMIQTSGVRDLPYYWDWITVSPKGKETDLTVTKGNELKLIYCEHNMQSLSHMVYHTKFDHYYLQPICLPDGSSNIHELIQVVLECGKARLPWKLGPQIHKAWGVE